MSPLGSWDLQCRARVVGMEEELWPNTCCQEAPKSSWKGREVAKAALEQLCGTHSSILGHTQFRWCCLSWQLNHLVPMLARSPLVSQLQQD